MTTEWLRMEHVRIQAVREEVFQEYSDTLRPLEELRADGQEHPDSTRVALQHASRRYLDTAREAHHAHSRWQAAQRLCDALIALA